MVSESKLPGATVQVEIVLILVLVEDGLGARGNTSSNKKPVLS